jgi:hypothetical protein
LALLHIQELTGSALSSVADYTDGSSRFSSLLPNNSMIIHWSRLQMFWQLVWFVSTIPLPDVWTVCSHRSLYCRMNPECGVRNGKDKHSLARLQYPLIHWHSVQSIIQKYEYTS